MPGTSVRQRTSNQDQHAGLNGGKRGGQLRFTLTQYIRAVVPSSAMDALQVVVWYSYPR